MHNKQHAFTLYELLSVLSLSAILSLIATPSMTELIKRNRFATLREELYNHLQNARTRAVITGKTTEICASVDGHNCDDSWSGGWILRDYQSAIILQQFTPATEINLQWSGYTSSIRFLSNGTSPTGNGRFYSCDQKNPAWQLIINRQGRVRTGTAEDNQERSNLCK